jgi:hypothetical protein
VVEPRRSGAASGINSTFRQVGIATGIAALGALFQASVTHDLGHQLGSAVSSGVLPPGAAHEAARQAFIDGLNEILVVAAIVAFAGAVLSFALVRSRDFVAHQAPAAA